MFLRRVLVLLLLAVLLSAAGLAIAGRRHGPDFEGGSFSIWLKRSGPDARVDQAVAREGAGLVPELIELVEWQPSRSEQVSKRVFDALPGSLQPTFRLLDVASAEQVRLQAMNALGGLGPDAVAALPALLAWAGTTGDLGRAALTAALRIGPESPAVTGQVLVALLDENAARREQTARALVATDVAVSGALPTLLERLAGPEPPSATVVEAVGVFRDEASRAVPRLASRSKEDSLKRPVLLTLRRLGPAAVEALAAIRSELNSNSPVVVEALDVVRAIGPAAAGVLPEVKRLEEHSAPMVRVMASAARGQISGDVGTAVRSLAREVQFQIPDPTRPYSPDHPAFRGVSLTPAQTAAWLLGEFGRRADSATPELILAMQGDDPRLCAIAAWSLWRITRDIELVVATLRRCLRFLPDPATQQIAVFAAGELGSLGTLVATELNELQRVSLPLRSAALAAQARLAVDGDVRVPP